MFMPPMVRYGYFLESPSACQVINRVGKIADFVINTPFFWQYPRPPPLPREGGYSIGHTAGETCRNRLPARMEKNLASAKQKNSESEAIGTGQGIHRGCEHYYQLSE